MKKMIWFVPIILLALLCGCPSPANNGPGSGNDTKKPDAPADLVVTNISSSSVRLTWTDASSNEKGFKINRFSYMSGSLTTIDKAVPNTTSYTDTGLLTYMYAYTVSAYNDAGVSSESNKVVLNVGNPVTAPSNVTAAALGSHSIELTWTQNTADCSYVTIERSSTSGSAGFSVVQTTSSQPYTDSGCAPTTTYWYRVMQTSSQNVTSGYSNTASATTTGSVQPPTGLTLNAGSASISLSWTASPTAGATYVIKRRSMGSSYAGQIATGITAPSYTDSTASAGLIYYYSVAALLGGTDTSSFTTEASAAISYVYNEVENNGPSSWSSSTWYYSGNSLAGLDAFEVKGGYSGSYAIYNPNQYKNYDYDVYKVSLSKGNSIRFTRYAGNVDLMTGMVVSLRWTDSSGLDGAHNFSSGGETYTPFLNAGLTMSKVYVLVAIPSGTTSSTYDFGFAITR